MRATMTMTMTIKTTVPVRVTVTMTMTVSMKMIVISAVAMTVTITRTETVARTMTMTVDAHNWLCGHRDGHFLRGSDTLTNNDLNILGVSADTQLAILDLHYCFTTRNPTPIPRTSTRIGQSWNFLQLTPLLNSTVRPLPQPTNGSHLGHLLNLPRLHLTHMLILPAACGLPPHNNPVNMSKYLSPPLQPAVECPTCHCQPICLPIPKKCPARLYIPSIIKYHQALCATTRTLSRHSTFQTSSPRWASQLSAPKPPCTILHPPPIVWPPR